MNNQGQSSQPVFTPIKDARNVLQWLRLIAESWALSTEVFLRKGFGNRYCDIRAGIAVLILLVYPAFYAGEDVTIFTIFSLLFLLMCGRARRETLRQRSLGIVTHSKYSGTPRLQRFFPRFDEIKIKSHVEPCFVALVGLGLWPFAPTLGSYLFITAIMMTGSVSSQLKYERAKAQQALDAMIEAKQHAERVRSMSGSGVI